MYRLGSAICLLFLALAFPLLHGQSPAVSLEWSTFVGGPPTQYGGSLFDIAMDADGNIVGVGAFESGFPVTPFAYDTTFGGGGSSGGGSLTGADAVIFKLSADGSTLLWSTYLGGSRADAANSVKIGPDGSVYISGYTSSYDFPTTPNAFQPSHGDSTFGNEDAFIAKLSSDGDSLLYCSFYGGLGHDRPRGMDLGPDGDLFVTGYTVGGDVPTTPGAFDESFNGAPGFSDIFVFRADPNSGALEYATFIGGSESESGHAIEVNDAGEATITGEVSSPNFPVTPNAVFPNETGASMSAYATRLSADGSQLLMSTYLSGNRGDYGEALALTPEGDVWIVGRTYSDIFPLTPDAYDNVMPGQGEVDCFLSRISADGTTLQYSSYFGDTLREIATDIVLTEGGELFISGNTVSHRFPVTNCTYDSTLSGGSNYWGGDAFLLKFDSTGRELIFSTLLGGFGDEMWGNIVLDDAACTESLVIGLTTGSNNYPVTPGVYQEVKYPASQFGITRFIESRDVEVNLPSGPCPVSGEPFEMSYSVADCGHWTDMTALEWNLGDGTIVQDSAVSHVYASPGDYMVTVAVPGCPTALDTVDLSLFGVDLGPDMKICLGEEVWLEAGSSNALSYLWHDGATDPRHLVDQTGTLWVEVVDALGCTASDSVNVELLGEGDIEPPNVFSPNGDGINDAFFVSGMEDKVFSLSVYDRWGALHYSSAAYQNDWKGGDLPEGTYYYILESPDLCGRFMGWVALLR